jgi:hypothetical protein
LVREIRGIQVVFPRNKKKAAEKAEGRRWEKTIRGRSQNGDPQATSSFPPFKEISPKRPNCKKL